MKIYYSFFIHKWTFHLIPSLNLYVESNSPLEHHRLIKDGFNGLYFSLHWGKWSLTLGIHKKFKNG